MKFRSCPLSLSLRLSPSEAPSPHVSCRQKSEMQQCQEEIIVSFVLSSICARLKLEKEEP